MLCSSTTFVEGVIAVSTVISSLAMAAILVLFAIEMWEESGG